MTAARNSAIHLAPLGSTDTTASPRMSDVSLSDTIGSNHTESDLTEEEIEQKPWKYIGYQGYASFLASEKDFYILRRFTSLNVRVALALQDQVVVLEKQLDELDKKYSRRSADESRHNGSVRCDREDRKALLAEIALKLSQYNSLVLQQSELETRPAPVKPDLKSIRNWHYNHGNCVLSEEEQDYLNHDDDLFSVVSRPKTPLRRLLERSRKFRLFSIWRTKKAPNIPVYDKDTITYTSNKRIDRFITIIIISIGTLMLIAPMWILQALEAAKVKLAVITAFIVVFLGLFSSMTDAKAFETLAATAAYSAVLMVFLQLGTTNS